MCILATANAGAEFSRSTLEDMFSANPDGAGWAYAKNGKIYYSKGYMNANKFIKAVQKLPLDVERLVHCRISTHGGVTKGLTHPFPVSKNYAKMETLSGTLSSGYILAHNGILSNFTPDKTHSDTEELVRCLANIKCDIMGEDMRGIINALVSGSRVAILNTDGKINRYGTGWTQDGGVWYSNTYFKYNTWRKYYRDWDDVWDDYSGYSVAPKNNLPEMEKLVALKSGEVIKNTNSKFAWQNVTDGSYLLDEQTNKLYGSYRGALTHTVYERCTEYNCGMCAYKCPFNESGGE